MQTHCTTEKMRNGNGVMLALAPVVPLPTPMLLLAMSTIERMSKSARST